MDLPQIIMLVILLLLAVLMVFGYLKRKKFNQNLTQMREELKVGDKVMTDTGVLGEIVEKSTEGEFNFVTLKTGAGKNVGYITVHEGSVYYIFKDGEPDYAGQNANADEINFADVKAEVKAEEKTVKPEATKKTKK